MLQYSNTMKVKKIRSKFKNTYSYLPQMNEIITYFSLGQK